MSSHTSRTRSQTPEEQQFLERCLANQGAFTRWVAKVTGALLLVVLLLFAFRASPPPPWWVYPTTVVVAFVLPVVLARRVEKQLLPPIQNELRHDLSSGRINEIEVADAQALRLVMPVQPRDLGLQDTEKNRKTAGGLDPLVMYAIDVGQGKVLLLQENLLNDPRIYAPLGSEERNQSELSLLVDEETGEPRPTPAPEDLGFPCSHFTLIELPASRSLVFIHKTGGPIPVAVRDGEAGKALIESVLQDKVFTSDLLVPVSFDRLMALPEPA